LAILAVGLPLLFAKRGALTSAGEVFIGVAVLILGVWFLRESVFGLGVSENDALGMWLEKVSNAGFAGVILFVFVGAALTVVAYSSAAVMVLTLVFIGEGLPFELAAAMIVGENLGTTITANLAALTGNIYAKRTALAHFLFNGFGVVWVLLLFNVFVGAIGQLTDWFFPYGHPGEAGNYDAARWGLCLFHTTFNLINAAVLMWLVDSLMNVVNRVIPFKGEDIVFTLEYIGNGPLNTPELSLLEAYKETARFGKITARMNGLLDKYMDASEEEERKTLLEKIGRYEDITDRIEMEIGKYLTALSRDEISQRAAERVRELLSVAGDLERVGDIYFQLAKKLESKNDERIYFLPEQRQNIKKMIAKMEEAFKVMQENLAVSPERVNTEAAVRVEDDINRLRDELKTKHLQDIGSGVYSLQSGVYYSDLFLALEKIGDLIASVSYAAAGTTKAG
jgi:phosphate:Na+ symporter